MGKPFGKSTELQGWISILSEVIFYIVLSQRENYRETERHPHMYLCMCTHYLSWR